MQEVNELTKLNYRLMQEVRRSTTGLLELRCLPEQNQLVGEQKKGGVLEIVRERKFAQIITIITVRVTRAKLATKVKLSLDMEYRTLKRIRRFKRNPMPRGGKPWRSLISKSIGERIQ